MSFKATCDHLNKLATKEVASGIRAYYTCAAAIVWAIGELVSELKQK